MSSKKYILAILLLSGVTVANAQEPMSLRDCMEYAISNSTKVRIQNAAVGDAQIDRRSAILKAFTPAVTANTYAYYNFGRSIDPETNTYVTTTSFHNSYSVSAGITIFDGFEAVNNLKISKTALAMGFDQMEQVEADICLATMEAYFNYVYYEQLAGAYGEQVETAQESLKLASKQEELGLKGHADVVQMEADLADREYQKINTENLSRDALITLKDVMFWPVDSVLVVDTEVPEGEVVYLDNMDANGILDYALNNNPSAKIAKGTMDNALLELNTAKWQLGPTISFYTGWSTTYYSYPGSETQVPTFKDQFSNNRGEYVELALSIPIYDRLSKQSNIAKKKNAVSKATAEYDQKLRDVQAEVLRAVQDRDGAAAAYSQAQKKNDVQEEAYNLNKKKYEQGLISGIEYQTATNNYLAAKADRLNALFKYLIKRSVVRYYNGEKYVNQ